MNDDEYDYKVHVAILGDYQTGKSTLLKRFVYGDYSPDSNHLNGRTSFHTKTILVDNKSVRLVSWDTAAQERFVGHKIQPSYYRKDGIILCYDATKQSSFDNLSSWLSEIEAHNTPVCLVTTKSDSKDKVVCIETAKTFADSHDLPLLETSAKHSTNINETFSLITSMILERKAAAQSQSVKNCNIHDGEVRAEQSSCMTVNFNYFNNKPT